MENGEASLLLPVVVSVATMNAAESYYRQLESAMLDGNVTDEEMALAESLSMPLLTDDRKYERAPGRTAVVETWP